jgi:type VI protein secretion system component VasF
MNRDDKNRDEWRDALSRFEQSQHGSKPSARPSRIAQRRDAIHAEIQRNRRGEYAVPTWVLAVVLVLIVAGIVLFVVFG